eukprot:TRINITY_DN273_c5_g1_i1.p1 TRINITY_DN273_c5_g1~~TRINITY_DN273_c5_g1_i1.p1  ORF type:complete len:199 (-),score=78.21 TRINITY_DN273_c5_g1_i1:33-629(-)
MNAIIEKFLEYWPFLLILVTTIVIGGLIIKLWVTFLRKKVKSIVLVGPSSSGKTALFFRLTTGGFIETVCSVQENSASINIQGLKKLQIVDIPSHLVNTTKNRDLINQQSTIFFLIDSITVEDKKTAELLLTFAGKRLVMVVNKTDQLTSNSVDQIKQTLKKQLNGFKDSQEIPSIWLSISAKSGDIDSLINFLKKNF